MNKTMALGYYAIYLTKTSFFLLNFKFFYESSEILQYYRVILSNAYIYIIKVFIFRKIYLVRLRHKVYSSSKPMVILVFYFHKIKFVYDFCRMMILFYNL